MNLLNLVPWNSLTPAKMFSIITNKPSASSLSMNSSLRSTIINLPGRSNVPNLQVSSIYSSAKASRCWAKAFWEVESKGDASTLCFSPARLRFFRLALIIALNWLIYVDSLPTAFNRNIQS